MGLINIFNNIRNTELNMEKFKNIFRAGEPEETEEAGIIDELWQSSTLSWSTRIKGFLFLFVLGTLISLLASIFFWSNVGGLVTFAVLYTLGNVCSIGSTVFLMGPVSQLKKMFASTRVIATIVMLVALVLTLISAFVLDDKFLCFLFIIIQFFAMLWYSISYIPFARDAVKKVAGSIIA